LSIGIYGNQKSDKLTVVKKATLAGSITLQVVGNYTPQRRANALQRPQITLLGENLFQEVGIECRGKALASDALLARVTLQQTERQPPQEG
jgi:hypothetical protein